MKRHRNLWLNFFRLLLSGLALALLLGTAGWDEVAAVLRAADLRLLLIAWGLFLAGVGVRTLRWRALLTGLGINPPFGRLLYLYLVGGFFNVFLPTGLGGDIVKVLELGEEEARSAAAGTVFVDRLTGLLSLMGLGLLVLPFTAPLEPWLTWTVALVCGGGLGAGFLLLQGRILRRLTRWLPGKLSLAGVSPLGRTYAAITGAGGKAITQALALSTLFNLLNVSIYWLCGRSVGIETEFSFYFIAVPLLTLTLLAPISVGGLGVRDWVAQPLFASVGLSAKQIAGMTLAVYAVTVAADLMGGVAYLGVALHALLRRPSPSR